MANILKYGQQIKLVNLASDPVSSENGSLYYNTATNKIRQYLNGSWSDVTAGVISLTGQSLNDGEIIVGNASNQSAAIDTDTIGDIQADHTAGLTIKSGVISNSHINASAAIAYSKLNLSDSIVNADINSAAAIAYSKLNLSNSIVNADINASAAIAFSKMAALTASKVVVSDGTGVITTASFAPGDVILKDGSVAFTANQSMGGFKLTNLAAPTANGDALRFDQLGANNGIATLDGGGKVPVSQLPNAVMTYEGVWNASTNSPTLSDGTGNAGMVYRVTVAGSQDLGSGSISFSVGDYAIYNSSGVWEKADTTDAVASVNGFTGIVVLDTGDIAEDTNLYFTDERAQDAVGAMVQNSSKVSLTYVDGTPSLTADIVAGSLVNADINASAAIAYSKLNLSNSIVNADINSAAAIALSKLAALTASRALVSDGTGVISVSAVTSTELGYVSGVTSAIQTQLDGKANQALSNLAAVAINTSLVSDTNNTDDLGSDSIEWKDAFVHNIKHGDATNPNLGIQTTSNNGSIVVSSHGTGNVDLDTEKFRRSKDGTNFVEEEYFNSITLSDAQTDAVIASLSFAHASFEGFIMEYKIKEATNNRVRIGIVNLVTNGTDISIVDQFNDTADVGVSFSAVVNGANIDVRYTTTSTGNDRTMRADVKRIKA